MVLVLSLFSMNVHVEKSPIFYRKLTDKGQKSLVCFQTVDANHYLLNSFYACFAVEQLSDEF